MDRRSDLERNENLSANLPVESVFSDVMVDADKVCSYCMFHTEDGEPDEELSEITLDNGFYMTIQLPFPKLDKLIRREPIFDKPKKTLNERE